MSKSSLRVAVRLVLLFTLVFALSLTQGWATTIGSTATPRPTLDGSSGQLYIYDGGFLANGDVANTGTVNWFGPLFSGLKDVTPLLFSDNGAGIFTVVGIGNTEMLSYTGSPESFGFGLQSGTGTATSSGTFTFGFVTGLVSSTGVITGPSTGSIGHDSPVDAPPGVSAGSTNDWVFTPSLSGFNVNLGTTFIIPGSNGTANFTLNNPSLGGTNVDRTYSANLSPSSSGVAEPGTFSLITGAGLVLAGLFRYRYSRGRG